MLFSAVLGQFKPDSGCDNSGDPPNQQRTLIEGHQDAKLAVDYTLELIVSVIKA